MDSMYQVAIEEMVDKVPHQFKLLLKPVISLIRNAQAFAAADVNKDGQISFAEFRDWALQDPTMTAWLEALGSVF